MSDQPPASVRDVAHRLRRDPDEDLGEPDRAARTATLDSLADVHLALNDAAVPFESAVWNADWPSARPT